MVNEYTIIEEFNKKEKYYTFEISNKDITYSYVIRNKYNRKRKLIDEIKVTTSDTEICILPESDKIEFYPLCSSHNLIYTYNLSNIENVYEYKDINIVNETYKKIKINSINDIAFLLYNYKGFYLIKDNKYENIELFNKDIYSIDLIYQKDNIILIPDYNQNYYFNKLYIINILNGKVKEIDFEYDISFESVFLGEFKNNVYLLDKKEEKEYRINLKRESIELVDFQILESKKMIKTTYKNIIKNNITFYPKTIFEYKIIDEYLYQIIGDLKIKISDKLVDKIIKNDNEIVYYLSDESLYMYNNIYGEVLLLNNFEWNFNNTNMIYIYK